MVRTAPPSRRSRVLSALNGKFGKIPSSAISERGVLGERDERGDGEEAGRRMGGDRGAQAATACSQAGKIAVKD